MILTEPLGDLAVVHLGVVVGDLLALRARPDHEGVHGPLDVVGLESLARRRGGGPQGTAQTHGPHHGSDGCAARRRGPRHALHAAQRLLERAVAHVAAGSESRKNFQNSGNLAGGIGIYRDVIWNIGGIFIGNICASGPEVSS